MDLALKITNIFSTLDNFVKSLLLIKVVILNGSMFNQQCYFECCTGHFRGVFDIYTEMNVSAAWFD